MNEPNQKDQIESVLADLAVQEVSERVPALFDHYIGFELIDKNEDGTRAAGLLGFGVRDQLFYVPILFLNGRIRGTEMLYLKDKDRFIALSRQWVDFLVNRTASSTGAVDDREPRGQVGLAQLQIFKSPQIDGKTASAPDFTFGEHKLEDLLKTACYTDECDITKFFKRAGDEKLYGDFVKWASDNAPGIMEGLFRFYDIDSLKIAEFDEIEPMAKKAADLLMEAQGEDGEPDLVVVTDPTAEEATMLDEEETVNLMQTGIGVVDNREETSVVVREESRQKIFNANELGVYDMITSDLEVNEVLIGPSPQPVENMGTAFPGTVVYDPDTNRCHHKFESPLYVEHERPPVMTADPDGEKLEGVFDGAVSLSSVQVGKSYVLISLDTKQLTAPVRIENKSGGRFRARTTCEATWEIDPCCGTELQRAGQTRPVSMAAVRGCDGVWIEEAADGAMKPFQTDEALFLPSTWKALPINDSYDHDADHKSVIPADTPEINLALASARNGIKRASVDIADPSVRPLTVTKRAGDTVMSWNGENGLFRKRAHFIHALIAATGVNHKEARSIADEVDEKNNFRGEIKVAYNSQIDIPWPEMDDSAGTTVYSDTPQVTNVQRESTGTIQEYDHQDVYDPDTADFDVQMKRQSGTADVMSRAAQSGIKQVFDPAMVAMLLRTNRVNVQIESEYLPVLEKSVDRSCRMLLMFYWHNAEFAETYGQDDLAEFEDVLLTAIKTLGQLTLFLRQKAVGASNAGIDAFAEAV